MDAEPPRSAVLKPFWSELETFYYFLITKYYYLSISQTIYVVLAFPEQIKKSLEEGWRLLDTAEYAEELTRQMGGEVAFPCNISINEIASHYTPLKGDRKFASKDLVITEK